MVDITDKGGLQKRFHALGKEADAIRAKSAPVRAKHDALAAKHAKEWEDSVAAVHKVEKGLADIDNERAAIARALGGATGTPE